MAADGLIDGELVLLGCGKMGSAMLGGWLGGGLPAASAFVVEPHPSDWLLSTRVSVNGAPPDAPAAVVIAVKPQVVSEAIEAARQWVGRSIFVSVVAGTPIRAFEAALGTDSPIIRCMPNTPAAIGRGITAMAGNAAAQAAHLDAAARLLQCLGQVVRLDSEAQMDAVTGLSGSGPAYLFHLIECMAAAGEAQGLPADLSAQLALATVAGAGALAEESQRTPAQLRADVTSPNGTTQAGLEQLMDGERGLAPLVRRTVAAATERSRELAHE